VVGARRPGAACGGRLGRLLGFADHLVDPPGASFSRSAISPASGSVGQWRMGSSFFIARTLIRAGLKMFA
jgi:hypothetical protein